MTTQKVLITAGASGIGLAIARAFAAIGAIVFVCDIDAEALAAAGRDNPGILTGLCDISKRADIERMVGEAIAALGGLDVLVNNAGVSGPTASVETMDPDAWDFVVQVNLTGTFNVTRLAIPYLKQSGSGVIITMSSVAGRFGYPNRSPYCTTKWGLVGFTKTLSMELGGFGIRANAILPGAVEGPRLEKVFDERQTGRRGETGGDANAIIEAYGRSERRGSSGGLPGIRCGEIDLRADHADRQRYATGMKTARE